MLSFQLIFITLAFVSCFPLWFTSLSCWLLAVVYNIRIFVLTILSAPLFGANFLTLWAIFNALSFVGTHITLSLSYSVTRATTLFSTPAVSSLDSLPTSNFVSFQCVLVQIIIWDRLNGGAALSSTETGSIIAGITSFSIRPVRYHKVLKVYCRWRWWWYVTNLEYCYICQPTTASFFFG